MKQKLKIAVWHNLPSGGGKRALYDHVRGLVGRGHTVESWCPPQADQNYLPLSGLIREHVVPAAWQDTAASNRVTEIVSLYRDPVNKLEAMDRHCRACAEQIDAGGFDVLLANTCAVQAVSSIARYVNIPKVIYLGEPYRMLYEPFVQESYRNLYGDDPVLPWVALPEPVGAARLKKFKRSARDYAHLQALRIQAREERLNAKAFDVILVNSFFSRENVLRTYGLDAKVCYLGVDTRKFVNRRLPREDFVVGLGMFGRQKNIDFVIKALAKVRAPRPKLIWIGNMTDNSYLRQLTSLAQDLGVDLDCRVGIGDEEVIDLLNRAAMMVYAPRLEPFGYAPLEANACGLPIVGVAEGGLRETVIDGVNGLLVESDPEAMAEGVTRLLQDRAYARELGERAYESVAVRWSLEAGIDRLETHLTKAVAVPSEGSTAVSR